MGLVGRVVGLASVGLSAWRLFDGRLFIVKGDWVS